MEFNLSAAYTHFDEIVNKIIRLNLEHESYIGEICMGIKTLAMSSMVLAGMLTTSSVFAACETLTLGAALSL